MQVRTASRNLQHRNLAKFTSEKCLKFTMYPWRKMYLYPVREDAGVKRGILRVLGMFSIISLHSRWAFECLPDNSVIKLTQRVCRVAAECSVVSSSLHAVTSHRYLASHAHVKWRHPYCRRSLYFVVEARTYFLCPRVFRECFITDGLLVGHLCPPATRLIVICSSFQQVPKLAAAEMVFKERKKKFLQSL